MTEDIMRLTEESVVNQAVIKQLQNENAALSHQIKQLDVSLKTRQDEIEDMRTQINQLMKLSESKIHTASITDQL